VELSRDVLLRLLEDPKVLEMLLNTVAGELVKKEEREVLARVSELVRKLRERAISYIEENSESVLRSLRICMSRGSKEECLLRVLDRVLEAVAREVV